MNKIKKRFKRDAKRILGNWLYIDKNREILPIWIEFYFWDKNNHKDEKACHIIDNDDYKNLKKNIVVTVIGNIKLDLVDMTSTYLKNLKKNIIHVY